MTEASRRHLNFSCEHGALYKALLQPLLKYLEDPEVEDFQIRSYGEATLIKTRGRVENIKDPDLSIKKLTAITVAIANMSKRWVDVKYPQISTILPIDSIRYTAEISRDIKSGIKFSIRIPAAMLFSPEDFGLTELEFEFLKEYIAIKGHNSFIIGGTGSGKTSLSNMLIYHIPAQQTIDVLGDLHDYMFNKNQEPFISELYAKKEEEYAQKVDLLMRSNPMRILISELRSENVNPIFRLMNTGHKGFMLTLHSNSQEGAVAHAFAKNLNMKGVTENRKSQLEEEIKDNIDFLIYVEKQSDGRRKVEKVTINNSQLLEKAQELGIFGYTKNVNSPRLVKYKPKKKHKRINITKIYKLRKEGKTLREIVEETKHGKATIVKILKHFK